MAKKNKIRYKMNSKNQIILEPIVEETILKSEDNTRINIGDYVEEQAIIYGINNNVGRSIPWLADGLTSVERRSLYTFYTLGLTPRASHEKIESVLGNMSANYYPHGTDSAYMTITRFGRTFSTMIPYIDTQGSYGNAFDKVAAASRYIEGRLSNYAYDCFFAENDVPLPIYEVKDNYKYTTKEPVYLSSKYPNILMQYNSGIGSGIASSICAFNSNDIFNATMELLYDPDAKIDIYPDCPMDVNITNKKELKGCFDKNRFHVKIEGKWHQEIIQDKVNGKLVDNYYIVFTSYSVNTSPKAILEYLIKLNNTENKKFKEIININATSSGDSGEKLEFYIQYEKGYDPKILAEKIIKATGFGATYPANLMLIKDNQPRLFTPREILLEWIEGRIDQKRRYIHQRILQIAKEKTISEAFIYLIENNLMDKVIDTIKKTNDDELVESLCKKFKLTELQAGYIIDLKLRRLTTTSVGKYKDRIKELNKEYKYLKSITNTKGIKKVIKEELEEGKKKYGVKRRATLKNKDEVIATNDTKYIVYNNTSYYCLRNLEELEKITDSIDKSYDIIKIKSEDDILIFSQDGYVRGIDGYSFNFSTGPVDIDKIFRTTSGINVSKMVRCSSKKHKILLTSQNGFTKLVEAKEILSSNLRQGAKVITLLEGDNLVGAVEVIPNMEGLVLYTIEDEVYYISLSSIPTLKRTSMGSNKLKDSVNIDNVKVIYTDNNDHILIYGESGYVKVIRKDYLTFNKKKDNIISMKGKKVFDVCAITNNDIIRVYYHNGHDELRFTRDDTHVSFTSVKKGEYEKTFNLSTTIGNSIKIFKMTKNTFYKITNKKYK